MTVGDIITDLEGTTDRRILSLAPATFYNTTIFLWLKHIFDRISDECRIPKATANVSGNSVASQSSYDLPTDCFDLINGIIAIYFDGASNSRRRYFQADLEEICGTNWRSPVLDDDALGFCEDPDDETKFMLLPALGSSDGGKVIKLVYVKDVAVPTSRNDTLPRSFNNFRATMVTYLQGMILELDQEGRGAAKIGEAEAYLKRRSQLRGRDGDQPRALQNSMSNSVRTYRNVVYGRSSTAR